MNFLYQFNLNSQKKSPPSSPDTEEKSDSPHYTPFQIEQIQSFKLPISYLPESVVYSIPEVVSTDLELIPNNTTSQPEKSMYNYLFNPTHPFSHLLIPNWEKQYTTDIEFLQHTKTIINRFDKVREHCHYNLDCRRILDIWDTVKQDKTFLERYSYIDWDVIRDFNHSPSFLQFMSVVNISSPLISLIIPFIFLLFPFVLLKIQRIPISFKSYMDMLKNLAKHHFIGKTIATMQSFSWEKLMYLLLTVGLYMLQIYQNVNSCTRYYNNLHKINKLVIDLREYAENSVAKITSFLDIASDCTTYTPFCEEAKLHRDHLILLCNELSEIKPFENTFHNFSNTGTLMKCFYHIYENPAYESSIKFSMGFEGYIDNMFGVCDNVKNGSVCFADFDTNSKCEFREQYYPPLMNENPVRNTCKFDKNMIISAPNKAGKTTILKTSAINIIFTQQFGCGFYQKANLIPYTHIHSYLNIPDTSERDSLFQAESRRCKDIIDTIIENNDTHHRHFCIFDELYSGTNPTEAAQAGKAFLEYMSQHTNVTFLLTTHYKKICKHFKQSKYIQNYKMDVNVLNDGKYEYKYKIKKGISHIKGAIRVLKDMDYPEEILRQLE